MKVARSAMFPRVALIPTSCVSGEQCCSLARQLSSVAPRLLPSPSMCSCTIEFVGYAYNTMYTVGLFVCELGDTCTVTSPYRDYKETHLKKLHLYQIVCNKSWQN